MAGPSFAYELCVARTSPEQRQALDLSSWEVAFNGAEPVRTATVARFAKAFARLAERLQPVRDPSRSPVFQVLFVLQKAPADLDGLAGFAVGERGARVQTGDLGIVTK